jgi:hypothetical protein
VAGAIICFAFAIGVLLFFALFSSLSELKKKQKTKKNKI